jgi:hypothetical protein
LLVTAAQSELAVGSEDEDEDEEMAVGVDDPSRLAFTALLERDRFRQYLESR